MTPEPSISTKSASSFGSSFAVGSQLVIWALIAIQIGRIASVVSSNGETPFLSANDRSRWSAMAALLEDQSFAIDRFLEKRDSLGRSRTWYSIDMVRHADTSGTEHYYSSKPPLLNVIYAGASWPVTMLLQKRLSEFPLAVGRGTLVVLNLLPLLWFYAWWRRRLLESDCDDWGRWLLFLAGLFGTFLTTFTVTLNNHLHAALCLLGTLILLEKILKQQHLRQLSLVFALGILAGFLVVCELPGLAWAAMLPLLFFQRATFINTWGAYLAGLLPVLGTAVLVNYYAHGDWRPPYYHREALGALVAEIENRTLPTELRTAADVRGLSQTQLLETMKDFDHPDLLNRLGLKSITSITPARRDATLAIAGPVQDHPGTTKRYAVTFDSNDRFMIWQWNDWYDYPRSYWLPGNKKGVDVGEPSRTIYAWNVLFGHHGIFSLTPLFMLVVPGSILLFATGSTTNQKITCGILIVSVVCILFYIMRGQLDRNYGGVCSGFRWQFWLIPAWLWIISFSLPASRKWWDNRFLQRAMEVGLSISIFSAWYSAANPWQNPWMYQLYLHLLGR